MRNFDELKKYRKNHPQLGLGDNEGGFFIVPCTTKGKRTVKILLAVIASTGGGWDHVSVSLPNRCPFWSEMDFIKRLFFDDHEIVMQIHPRTSDHINVHSFCLHLWRPHNIDIPLPPKFMV